MCRLLVLLLCVLCLGCDALTHLRHRGSLHAGGGVLSASSSSTAVQNFDKLDTPEELYLHFWKLLSVDKICTGTIWWHYTTFDAAKAIVESKKFNSGARKEILFTKLGPDYSPLTVLYNNFGAWNQNAVQKMAWVIGVCFTAGYKGALPADYTGGSQKANERWSDQWSIATAGIGKDLVLPGDGSVYVAYATNRSPIKFNDFWKARFDKLWNDNIVPWDAPRRWNCDALKAQCLLGPAAKDEDEKEEKEYGHNIKVGDLVTYQHKSTEPGLCVGKVLKVTEKQVEVENVKHAKQAITCVKYNQDKAKKMVTIDDKVKKVE